MSFQGNGVTFLNIDGAYVSQPGLRRLPHEWIDLMDVAHTNLYCEQASLCELERRIQTCRNLVFIGSGNYHYISYLLMKRIQEPFTLILFDNHTDIGNGTDHEQIISCGSWVSYALELPLLQRAVIVGPTRWQSSLFSSETIVLSNNIVSPNLLLSHIQTENVYISIDKDVLREEDAMTNWDHGTMPLSALIGCLQELFVHKNVVGIDICGEYPQASIYPFDPVSREAVRKNEHANMCIAHNCLYDPQPTTFIIQ
ncbi:arginase family protein [Anoxybacillus sp. B7M1]|jgi:arginase family enzyme|uniref:Arginase family protein n=1 Tax=Anoxybacteroides rupiense TaxID=311460 RepID=A0ABD5IXV0_9BACL|nr:MULTISPECIES: arginase family protein [Anoxybacillus]ANB57558.1 arginase family protein [Anoxybacillus sp. B2M1]ANB65586.1 arginase family protein [Anoxybacillus sp. B7M1]MBB3907848.1 arginase family enzyme [Anoxybacillus rupiensis]MBS2772868.1 arginase family protein [Anoxybacillus rupiensis]MDE8563375.1 arginase family protein [Anoxybacillus rupiensis]